MKIVEASTGNASLRELITLHRLFCEANTPAGSGHAISESASDLDQIRYFLAIDGEREVGCIGLKPVETGHAEIKTMHVRSEARGRGVGALLVQELIHHAKALGLGRLSLETGKSSAFAASRRLYERMGFEPCAPFGDYANDSFSYCMTKKI